MCDNSQLSNSGAATRRKRHASDAQGLTPSVTHKRVQRAMSETLEMFAGAVRKARRAALERVSLAGLLW